MIDEHDINRKPRINTSLIPNQRQQRERTRSRWMMLQIDTFKNLVKSDRSKNFFDVCIWFSTWQPIVMEARSIPRQLSFVAPQFINSLVKVVEEEI